MTLSRPGFADPVLESQACFRAVLDAMARPGTIHAVTAPADPPPPLHRATAAVLLTLVDADTPLWLDAAAEAAWGWIAFHAGAPQAPRAAAAFALALTPMGLTGFATGTDDGPEEAATLILQVSALGAGQALRISGPGLAAHARLRVDGLASGFVAEWAANRRLFPRGVDLILCAGDRLTAFPRTLMIEEG